MPEMEKEIVLYDARPKGDNPTCFSPYVWRIRMILNFKGLPYRTEWVEFPDVAKTLKAHGVTPHRVPEECYTEYTVPAVKLPTGEYIMDSPRIAEALERLHPEPTIRFHAPETQTAQNAVFASMSAAIPAYLYRLPDEILAPRAAEYYHRERQRVFGMTLHEASTHPYFNDDAAKNRYEESQKGLLQLLSAHPEGSFVLGEEMSYSDFVLAGWWKMLSKVDHEGDLHGKVMKYDQNFSAHEKACAKLYERDT